MLKWAVGQRIPSSASSTCSDITPSVACCSSTFRHHQSTTFKLHSSGHRHRSSTNNVRTAYVRNLNTADKENRKKCRRSSENNSASSGTKRTRDSIYMHLDSIPVALRDVSNHWSPGSCGDNAVERDTKSTKRKHVRLKKSPCRVSSHKCTSNNLLGFVPAAVTVVAEQPANSNETNEQKNDVTDRLNGLTNVTQTVPKKPLLEKKKQPCSGEHHPFVTPCAGAGPPPKPLATSKAAPSMLFDTPQYFTIQTSPPEEPDELFHKALPLKRSRPLSDDCDTLTRCNRLRLRPSVCDIPESAAARPPCEVSTLTRSLSWLKLYAARKDSTFDICSPAGPPVESETLDDLTLCDSSLEITNPNSAVLSDTNLSSASLATSVSSKPGLKRKCVPAENATYVISDAAAKVPNTVERIIKSKRRCVIFNEQSFTLNTPPLSEDSRNSCSSGATSLDLDQPSTLRRQKVIRRKRRQNHACVPQTVYNKNLKSVLTLPHGIPSPFEMNDTQFKILSRTPFSTCTNISDMLCDDEEDASDFSVLKKAVSTPKPDCPFDLTEDVFLSPGVRPLLDSVIMQTTCSNTMTAVAAADVTTTSLSKVKDEEDTNCFVSPVCEQTWNSHGQLLPKAVSSRDNDIDSSVADSTRSSNSSRINDDQDGFSSIVSSTPTQASTSTIDRPHPRSRRCLSFMSPTTPKSTVKPNRMETGQLDIRIYYNNGLLTVHIIRGRNLHKLVEPPCNAYVKMNLVPQGASKTFHRTCVRKNSFNPKFDHKFSMEITESDLNKRVLISTWHRDRGKRKSEFLGCMSFAIKNILKKEINGSYKLVSHSSNKSSYHSQVQQSQEDLMASRITNIIDDRIQQLEAERLYATGAGNPKLKTTTITKKDTVKVYEEYMFLQHLELEPSTTATTTTTTPPTNNKEFGTKSSGRTPCTTTHKLVKQQSDSSYGFTIAWTKPPRVERVDANSLADKAGLRPGDFVVFVNKTNVITRCEEQILEIIQNCGNQLVLEIYRKPMANGTISNSAQRNSTPSATRQHSMTRRASSKINRCESVANNNVESSRSTTAYSTATAASTSEASRKRLQLPQITFSSEVGSGVIV